MAISEPVNPLGAHVGGGSVLIHCEEPVVGIADQYEIQVGETLAGNYFTYNRSKFYHNIALLKNLPYGNSLYFRIRAITVNQEISNWVQVKRGVPQLQTATIQIKSISGSSITENAKFITLDNADRLSGFMALQAINITG